MMMMSPFMMLLLAVALPMVYSGCGPRYRLKNPPPGRPFYIVQKTSCKPVHPLGGSCNPCANTKLVLYSGGFGQKRIQFKFERCPWNRYGYGFLKHVTSGKYVHPLGGSKYPCNNTPLVFYPGKHGACLFGFGADGNIYQYSSGKTWHPLGGSCHPRDNTVLVLHSGSHAATKFYYKLACRQQVEQEEVAEEEVASEE